MFRSILRGSRRARRKAFKSRVWLNGDEVTNRCQEADTRKGYVLLLKQRGGRFYADESGHIAAEVLRGKVTVQ